MTSTLPTWFDDVDAPVDAVAEHVVLRVGGSRYAVPATAVAEVVEVPVLTRVPGLPGWVVGVANWRGHVLPVIDLKPLLGVVPAALPSSARVVVVVVDETEVGIVADAVLGLVDVPVELPELPPALGLLGSGLLLGVVDVGAGGPLAVVSTDALLGLSAER